MPMSWEFQEVFEQITECLDPDGQGYPPYQWQIDLFEEWCKGTFRLCPITWCN
jgi:hypothetical protein